MVKFKIRNQKPQWTKKILFVVILVAVQSIFAFTSIAQNITVKGKVSDSQTGELLPGVNVVIKGTTKGTVTLMDGTYEIEVSSSDVTLMYSFIGYNPV